MSATTNHPITSAFGLAMTSAVRRNMRIELCSAMAYGMFTAACLQFIPVVLRRLGASTDQLAIYGTQSYFGSFLALVSVMLIGQRQPKGYLLFFWTMARGAFLCFAFVHDVRWALLLTGLFFVFESFPSPAYARIVKAIYPEEIRGRVISLVGLGKACAVMLVAPLAGWALDRWGFQLLFPLAGALALLATAIFSRIAIPDLAAPRRQAPTLVSLWQIARNNRQFVIHLLGVIFFGLGMNVGSPLFPLVQVDRLNLSYSQVGWLGMAQSIAWLIGLVVCGRLIDQRGPLWTLRASYVAAFFIPFTYIWAESMWTLLPAFIAAGIVTAGVDMAFLTVTLQLAEPDKVLEYAALQSSVVGLRGMAGVLLGAGMVRLGFADTTIFALGALLVLVAWWVLGPIQRPPAMANVAAPLG